MQARLNKLSIAGTIIFVGLYIYASTLYPGGSQANTQTEGFDWIHNYWCNLMSVKAVNGQNNPARPFSIAGMIILCLSYMIFFVQFADAYAKNNVFKLMIKVGGVISMIFAMFIFTNYHDLMTILSSLFGLFAVVGIVIEIYKSEWLYFKLSGFLCIILLAVNNYVYYSQHYLELLPLLQKITFVFVLTWVSCLNFKLLNKIQI